MTRAQLEEAHRDAHRVYCMIGLLKEKADSDDDACLEGTLEAAEALMDDVTSALMTLVAEAKSAEEVFASGDEDESAPPLVPHHPHDRVVGAMKGEA